jgi:hypothetical protein
LKLMREVQQRLWWCQVDTLKSMKRKSDFWPEKLRILLFSWYETTERTVVSNEF